MEERAVEIEEDEFDPPSTDVFGYDWGHRPKLDEDNEVVSGWVLWVILIVVLGVVAMVISGAMGN